MSVQPVDPARTLVPPVPEEPVPDLVQGILSIPDYVSPAHWMLVAMEDLFGVNPAKHVAEWFAGDWRGVATYASTLENVSAFEHDLAANLRTTTRVTADRWQGNAADAAWEYFAGLESAILEHAEALENLAAQYNGTAKAMWGLATAAVSVLEMLADAVIDYGLGLLAAALVSGTGVGAVLGAGYLAYLAFKATTLWFRLLEILARALAAAEALVGLIVRAMAGLKGPADVRIPGTSYDNLVVN